MAENVKSTEEMNIDELRKKVTDLDTKFKRTVIIGSTAVTLLSGLGYGKIQDIELKAREKVDGAVKKSVDYFDLVVNGQSRVNGSQWESALPYFESARSQRPDDEFVLYNLLMCYANGGQVDAGIQLLEEVERSGLFSRKTNQIWTLLSAGRVYLLAALEKPELFKKADYYLGRARRASELQKSGDLSYVLYAQATSEYMQGRKSISEEYLHSLIEMDPRARDWPSYDRPDPWFQMILKKHPKYADDFEKALKSPSRLGVGGDDVPKEK